MTTIDTLPDDVLLEIFDVFRLSRSDSELRNKPVWNWHILVHVCRRWRQVAFASPIRLDLLLLCTYGTPVRRDLGCWPAFPIFIDYDNGRSFSQDSIFEDDVVAALEHPSRVRHINLMVTNPLWRKLAPLMQEPFPALTHLSISSVGGNLPLLPSGFLGGSAPCLREVWFDGMPILALPTLLSSTSNIVNLILFDPDALPTGIISPEALVTGLAMLPRLNHLSIGFVPSGLHDYWPIHVSSKTRVVLPALTSFFLEGEPTFLEDLVSQIDTPMLNWADITYRDFSGDPIPQLFELLKRSHLNLSQFTDAKICIDDCDTISIFFGPRVDPEVFPITIHVKCDGIDYQASCMAQVLSQTSAMLLNVVDLEIKAGRDWRLESFQELEDVNWLNLLRPFTAANRLHVSKEFAVWVTLSLEETTASQVLPALNLLFLESRYILRIEELFALLRNRGCPNRPFTILHYEAPNSKLENLRMSTSVGDRQTSLVWSNTTLEQSYVVTHTTTNDDFL